ATSTNGDVPRSSSEGRMPTVRALGFSLAPLLAASITPSLRPPVRRTQPESLISRPSLRASSQSASDAERPGPTTATANLANGAIHPSEPCLQATPRTLGFQRLVSDYSSAAARGTRASDESLRSVLTSSGSLGAARVVAESAPSAPGTSPSCP